MEEGMAAVLQELVSSRGQTRCRGCGSPIQDRFLLRVGSGEWHEGCVRCVHCCVQLYDRCFERDEKLFCRLHYYKEFSANKCSGCKEGVGPTEMVYKLKNGILYHIECHRCVQCGKELSPGEEIVVDHVSAAVACLHHYTLPPPTAESPPSSRMVGGKVNEAIQQTPVPPTFPVHEPGGTSFRFPNADGCGYYGGAGGSEDNLPLAQKYLKRRGPRTTIKQGQLDVLNRIFNATPKPSKHARAKLALETGLSMRVIQVWFQNRRSKERRLKHLCNWIRENESRGLIAPISPAAIPLLSPPDPHPHCDDSVSDDGATSSEHQY